MWIRALIITFFLCLISGQTLAQDLCAHCENSGCLESFEKAKSQDCKSCQICLVDNDSNQPGNIEHEAKENSHDETIINFGPNTITFDGALKDETQKIKDCAQDKWENDVSCKDLKAQESMRDSADKIIWLTLTRIALSLLGLGGILWSLREARKANKISADGVKEAAAAVEASREALEFERSKHRPWLNINAVEIKKVIPNSVDPNIVGSSAYRTIEVGCEVENVGQASAIDIVCHAGVFMKKDYYDQVDNYVVDQNLRFSGSIAKFGLGPGGKKDVFPDNYTGASGAGFYPCNLMVPSTDFQFLIVKVHYSNTEGMKYMSYVSFIIERTHEIRNFSFFESGAVLTKDDLHLKEQKGELI